MANVYPSRSADMYAAALRKPDGFGLGDALGSLQTSGTTAGAMTGNPVLAGVGAATDIIGTGFNIYNALSAADQAEKNYEEALRQYEEQKKRQEKLDAINLEQLKLGNLFTGGEYANKLREQGGATQNYYQSIGA